MLLGLSNSPARESDFSTEDEEFLPSSPSSRRAGGAGSKGSPTRRGCRKLLRQESNDESEDGTTASISFNAGAAKNGKKLPGRCKCGKRVSASHPPCKSELMLLCERFCDRFGHLSASGEPTRIHLNECAIALGVPRRRLYDITIVYEAVEVVKRTGKLAYVWRGMAHLPALVEQLKREEEGGYPVGDRKGNSLLNQATERQTPHSLWALSRKFIRLLLITKGPIQLTEAAEHLIGEQMKTPKRQQTQITVERRLYDIGSILATLNLIHRTYIEGKRQPAFSWNWDWKNVTQTVVPHDTSFTLGAGTVESKVSAATPLSAMAESTLQSLTLPNLTSGFQIPALTLPAFAPPRTGSCETPHLPVGNLDVSLPQAWSLPSPAQVAFPPGLAVLKQGYPAPPSQLLRGMESANEPPARPGTLPWDCFMKQQCSASVVPSHNLGLPSCKKVVDRDA